MNCRQKIKITCTQYRLNCMTDKRKTYKKAAQPAKKPIRITIRINEEEHDRILKNTRTYGFRTMSEYLRYSSCFPESPRLTDSELQELRTDITYCREWIEGHKEVIDSAIEAIHLALKLFS